MEKEVKKKSSQSSMTVWLTRSVWHPNSMNPELGDKIIDQCYQPKRIFCNYKLKRRS